ncbi:MAG: hypothetical protein FWE48_07610 [Coriobacteriia bacterium]|nr:hypothetical protein [Coriobacteriia bacterium]MCL2746932.1 hypothetical protein [Coriobacteriia bacterium]
MPESTPAIGDIIIDSEFQYLLPPLDPESFATLEADILERGIRDALVLWKDYDILIDGHNRYEVIKKHDLPFTVTSIELPSREDVIIWIVTTQIARRNLAALQMSYYRGVHYQADRLIIGRPRNDEEDLGLEKSGQTDHINSSTATRLSRQYNVSPKTIRRDSQVATGIDAIGAISSSAKRMILAGEVPITRTKLQALGAADTDPAYAAEVAVAIEDGTYGRGPDEDGQALPPLPEGGRPTTVQAYSQLSASIRRSYTQQLRQLTGGDPGADPAVAKPALRTYIESLQQLYQRL